MSAQIHLLLENTGNNLPQMAKLWGYSVGVANSGHVLQACWSDEPLDLLHVFQCRLGWAAARAVLVRSSAYTRTETSTWRYLGLTHLA